MSDVDRAILDLYARREDRAAFEALASAYSDPIARMVGFRLRGRIHGIEEPAGLAHEVLLKLHADLVKRADPRAIEALIPWISRCVGWVLTDAHRARGARDRREVLAPRDEEAPGWLDRSPPQDPPAAGGPDVVEALTDHARAAAFRRCAEGVEARPRESLRLQLLGIPYIEIARSLGYANPSGPKKARDAAVEAIRRCLEKGGWSVAAAVEEP